jgi:hypothetical protein
MKPYGKGGKPTTYMGKSMKPGGGGQFAKMVDAMKGKVGVKRAKAIAASAGRKKYGAKKMAKFAAAGRKRAAAKKKGK